MQLGQKFYRIVDGYNATDKPVLQTVYVAKLTPKGGWVVHAWTWPLRIAGPLTVSQLRSYASAKLVIQGTRRSYAYPTVELALDSYKIRKRRQMGHAQASMDRAVSCLEWAHRAVLEPEFVTFTEPVKPKYSLQPERLF
jgi:hypothetical protein